MHQNTRFWPPKLKNLPTVGGGKPPSHTLPPLGRFAPSGLVAPLPRIFPYKLETIPPTFEDLSTPLLKTVMNVQILSKH